MSNWNRQLAFKVKNRFGKRLAYTVPATLALIVVWLATGAWHGASWAYIIWGLLNGLFIILSIWLDPAYEKWKSILKINDTAWGWRAFQTIRTFILVTFIKVLPEVGTLAAGVGLWARIFTSHSIPTSLSSLLPFVTSYRSFGAAMIGTVLLFITSLIQRRQPIRQWLEEKTHYLTRILIFVILFFCIVYSGVPSSGMAGGFLYAQF